MNRIGLVVMLMLCVGSTAAAQTEGRVGVGASVTYVHPTSEGVDSVVSVGPVVRLNPKRGWGPAAALNWFRADIANPTGEAGDFARMRIRPLMAGVAYSVGSDTVLPSFSVVAGISFNRIDFEDAFLDRLPPNSPASVDIENSFAFRPGVNVTFTVAPRVAIIGFGGFIVNRPDVVYRDPSGTEFRNRWKADSFAISAGMVYSIF
jgi:hypothetical protein